MSGVSGAGGDLRDMQDRLGAAWIHGQLGETAQQDGIAEEDHDVGLKT